MTQAIRVLALVTVFGLPAAAQADTITPPAPPPIVIPTTNVHVPTATQSAVTQMQEQIQRNLDAAREQGAGGPATSQVPAK